MPFSPVSFTLTSDPAEAKAWFAPLIAREPILMSVIASNADSLVDDPARCANPRWWAGRVAGGELDRDPGGVVAAFMHTPPHDLHVGLATPQQARALAADLAAAGPDRSPDALSGVGGIRPSAEAFADEWAIRTGQTARVVIELGVFDLPERPHLRFRVPGRFRLAGAADVAQAEAWAQDFSDALELVPRASRSLAGHVAAGRVGLWELDGRAVSMAYASPSNGGVTRVSGVWTPPGLRGNGYASAVVAGISAARMDSGETCMLYTDLANPTSNAIYQALGYRRVGDSVTIAFT